MSADEFWNGDPWLARDYAKAWEYKRKQQNELLWLQGRYVYDALCEASPLFRTSFSKGTVEAREYTKEPYPITKEEAEARRLREEKARMEQWKQQFMEFASGIALKMAKEPRPSSMQKGEGNG